MLRVIGAKPDGPIIGDVTGYPYHFHRKSMMFVDKRDAIFFLGPDFEEV